MEVLARIKRTWRFTQVFLVKNTKVVDGAIFAENIILKNKNVSKANFLPATSINKSKAF